MDVESTHSKLPSLGETTWCGSRLKADWKPDMLGRSQGCPSGVRLVLAPGKNSPLLGQSQTMIPSRQGNIDALAYALARNDPIVVKTCKDVCFFCLSVGCEGVYKPPVPLHLLACCLYISVLSVLMHLQIAKHLLQHGFEPQAICTMISCLINSKVGLSRANQTKSHENCLRFLSFMLNTCSDWAGQQHLVLWHWSQWVGATCSLCYTKTPAVTCLSAANTSKLAEVIVRSPAIFDSSRLSSLACNQSFKKFKIIGDMFRIKILEVDATPQRSSLSSK